MWHRKNVLNYGIKQGKCEKFSVTYFDIRKTRTAILIGKILIWQFFCNKMYIWANYESS